MRNMRHIITFDVDTMLQMIVIFLGIYSAWRIGNICRMFYEQALGAATLQTEKVQTLFDDMLGISKNVQEEASRSTDSVDNLYDTTKQVTISMQEIVDSATATAENIEEQSRMTQAIQDAIFMTGERSKKMVDIATASNNNIHENMKVMDECHARAKVLLELYNNSEHKKDLAEVVDMLKYADNSELTGDEVTILEKIEELINSKDNVELGEKIKQLKNEIKMRNIKVSTNKRGSF